VAAMVLALRSIILEGVAPRTELLLKLTLSSVFMFVFGLGVFRNLKQRFYDYM
jgi:hypothetical protein